MNPPETAPKDGTVFLAQIGWPILVSCMWSDPDDGWSCAIPQTDMYHGKWNDRYFETQRELESDLKGWIPLPTV
jgi:hypothetical protein